MTDTMMRLLNRIEAMLPMPWMSCLLVVLVAYVVVCSDVVVRFWMALVLLTRHLH